MQQSRLLWTSCKWETVLFELALAKFLVLLENREEHFRSRQRTHLARSSDVPRQRVEH